MNLEQAKQLLDSLFVAFPALEQYVMGLPNPQATIDEWRRVVAKLNFDHASEAVRRMRDYEAAVPEKPWEVSSLPGWIKAVTSRVADESAKFALAESVRRAKEAASPGQSCRRGPSFRRAYEVVVAAKSCLVRGEITPERNAEIVEAAKRTQATDELVPVPDDIRREYESPRDPFYSLPAGGLQPLAFRIRNFS
jgi:hypothetical protein